MTMQASIYGRVGLEPRSINTKSGTPMTGINVAVDVTPYNQDEAETVWFSVTGFSKTAEAMMKLNKGDMVAAMGKVTLGHWTNQEGEIKESWQLTADSIVSSRTSRPNQQRRKSSKNTPQEDPPPEMETPLEFDDEIPF